MAKGIIYILTNEGMPNLIKIGKTKDLKERLKSLYNSSVPKKFEVHYAIEIEDYEQIEKKMHEIFSDKRINPGREFFTVEPERAALVLELTKGHEVSFNDNEIYDANDIKENSQAKTIAPAFRFSMVRIRPGETLVYMRNNKETCIVAENDKDVIYKGETLSISLLTAKLQGRETSTGIQGQRFWMYEDELLTERRARMEQEENS